MPTLFWAFARLWPGIRLAPRPWRSGSTAMMHFARVGIRHLAPATTLIVIATLSSIGFAAHADEPRTIEVVARRFAFEPAVIEVAVGEPVRLVVRSADGVHGIEIKKFKVKKEIPRGGEAVVIDFTPKTA